MSPLKVLLISDGRPGHFRLSEGIVAALGRLCAVEEQRLEVRRRRLLPTRTLAWLIKAGLPPAQVLKVGYGLDARTLSEADVIVSAGGDTLAANVAIARLLGAPNIFYGSLRRYDAGDFALALSSYERPGQVMTLKPSAFDPDTLPSNPVRAGLIVGGNTPDIRFDTDDWERLGAFLRTSHATSGTRWIVSNSRRTPAQGTRLLADIAADTAGPIERFIDVTRPGSATLVDLFAQSTFVVCTADSSSMLSESVWARRPVIAIRPTDFALTESEAGYRRYLDQNNWARELPIIDLTPERITSLMSEMRPLDANPLDQLTATLNRELPTLFAAESVLM